MANRIKVFLFNVESSYLETTLYENNLIKMGNKFFKVEHFKDNNYYIIGEVENE